MIYRWAIIQCDTTGLHIKHDHLFQLSVLVVSELGIEASFSSLIKPPCPIPTLIGELSRIDSEQLITAPSFAEIAADLTDLLSGCIIVAHNARFHYAFLKNNLKALGFSITTAVLCTIKLFKRLYPHASSYHLKDLAMTKNLPLPAHHPNADNVYLIYELLTIAQQEHGLAILLEQAKACYRKASVPSKLKTDLSTLPESAGVYLLYGEQSNCPLYIGKSITLRQRVLAHFQADHTHPKEFKLAQQVERVDFIATAGELSALLLESELIKAHSPIFNRRLRRKKMLVGFHLTHNLAGYFQIETLRLNANESLPTMYGSYSSGRAAKQALVQLVKEHNLCPKLCGLEQSRGACFAYQLKRCSGACTQKEQNSEYNDRVIQALEGLQQMIWPFQSAIGIKEQCPVTKITQWLKFDQWRYLGSTPQFEELNRMQDSVKPYDLDSYRILLSYLKRPLKLGEELVILG